MATAILPYGAASADEPLSIDEIARRAAVIEAAAGNQRDAASGRLTAEDWARIRAIAAGARSAPDGERAAGAVRGSLRYAVLVSFAQPETVRLALAEVAGRDDAAVVFRGLPGNSLQAFYAAIRPLIAGLEPTPAVTIDPPTFRRFNLVGVPAVVDLMTGALVRGTVSIAALQRFGTATPDAPIGPVNPIAEEDLAAVLRTRAAALDGPGITARAQEQYWSHQRIYALPRATHSETRMVDPSVTASADIVTSAGVVIARAGQRVNPLDLVPFGLTVIAFDGSDPGQVAIAKREAALVARPVLVVTDFDRKGGWTSFGELEDELQAPVYLLDERLARRLSIVAVPAIVTGAGTQLQIRTVAVGGPPP